MPKRPFYIGIFRAYLLYIDTLKSRSECYLYVPCSTVTRFWVLVDTIEHIYLAFGPFSDTSAFLFGLVFFKPLWPSVTPFQAASTSQKLNIVRALGQNDLIKPRYRKNARKKTQGKNARKKTQEIKRKDKNARIKTQGLPIRYRTHSGKNLWEMWLWCPSVWSSRHMRGRRVACTLPDS